MLTLMLAGTYISAQDTYIVVKERHSIGDAYRAGQSTTAYDNRDAYSGVAEAFAEGYREAEDRERETAISETELRLRQQELELKRAEMMANPDYREYKRNEISAEIKGYERKVERLKDEVNHWTTHKNRRRAERKIRSLAKSIKYWMSVIENKRIEFNKYNY